MIEIKCRVCGDTFKRCASILRKDKTIGYCSNCVRSEREKLNVTKRLQRERERTESRRIKEEKYIRSITKIRKCKQCEREYSTTKNIEGFCCIQCSKRYSNNLHELRRRHRLRENGKIDYSITLDKLIKRDKGKCRICGEKVDVDAYSINVDGVFVANSKYPSIDHINPVSKGGTHSWDNIQLAHMHCNTTKSNKPFYENEEGQIRMSV